MIPAHKYRNREFMPHEFQLIHNSMSFATAIVHKFMVNGHMTELFAKEVANMKEAMSILESKR